MSPESRVGYSTRKLGTSEPRKTPIEQTIAVMKKVHKKSPAVALTLTGTVYIMDQ